MSLTPRWQPLDIARGLAVVAMVLFHTLWDVAHFGYISQSIPWSAPVKTLGHAIAFSFLFIAGVSLTLSHRDKIDWRGFLRRLIMVVSAAAMVSIGTYVAFPTAYVFFGILHCIALASILALPLLIAPWQVSLFVGSCFFILPIFFSSSALNADHWQWLGLSTSEPMTQDWRPLFPWAGALFVGVAAGKRFAQCAKDKKIGNGPVSFLGRHSLIIYLLHQPVLFAFFSALTVLLP